MQVIKILNKHLELNLKIDSYFRINNELINAEFEYDQLRNTTFDFAYNQKRVLHFTSIESARLILENNYLRGSNFNDFEDEFEIIDVLKKINNSISSDWSRIKAHTFAISLTEKLNDKVQENYHYHWEKYGNNYQGVALEFEFCDRKLPYGFYPLRVNYIDNDNQIVKDIKYSLSDDISLSCSEKEFILPILASTKDKVKFKNEKEVRLMFKISEASVEHLNNSPKSDIYFSFDKNNSIKLELRVNYSTPNDDSHSSILKLKRIYLGNSYINSEDNISSSLLMTYFEKMCNKRGVELRY